MDNEEQQQAVNNSPGVLIDNDSGETTAPHPLSHGVDGANDSENQDDTDTGDQNAEGDESQNNDEQAGDNNQQSEQSATAPTTAQPQAPQVQTTRLEDPGEFVPNKDGQYSFDITLADGSKYRIEKPEDIDKLPPTPEFATIQDHAKFNAAYTNMVTGINADMRAYTDSKKEYDNQKSSEDDLEQYISGIEGGMVYLEKTGKLPALPAQYTDVSQWEKPEVAQQPGVKERLELINYITKENAVRAPLGLPRVTVLEAYAELRNKQLEEQSTQRTQKQNEVRKQRGAMVGGASAPAPNKTSSDMIVGSGGSLRDLGV